MSRSLDILLVDDEQELLRACSRVLNRALQSPDTTVNVCTCDNAEEARELLVTRRFDAIVLDVKIPGVDGLDLFRFALQRGGGAPVALITGDPTFADAVTAVKEGAFDYVSKPFSANQLTELVQRALAEQVVERRGEPAAGASQPAAVLQQLAGESSALERLRVLIAKVAPLRETVLLLGETGAGKGLVAELIHRSSPWHDLPFVTVECGAIPSELMESELFGHERGAFTGAQRARVGLLELAGEGTIFFDEIGELPLLLQPKVLRAIQEREFRRVGGTEVQKLRARIVAATNRELLQRVAEGHFREDLYYRLNVVNVAIPPLRERSGDIEALALRFLAQFNRDNPDRAIQGISPAAMQILGRYPWPGNVRELQNAIRGACALASGRILEVSDLHAEIRQRAFMSHEDAVQDFARAREHRLSRFEEEYFRNLLGSTSGNIVAASRVSGVSRATLYRYLDKYQLDPSDFRV